MIIGITGDFGSGKSTVARLIAKSTKSRILDADKIAKNALKKKGVIDRIRKMFPAAVVGNTVSKKKLAAIVFGNKSKLKKLEGIIHPVVTAKIKQRLRENTILDVPLLIEGGLHHLCDIVIVVKCVEKTRIERLIRKGFSPYEIKARTRMQLPIKTKLRHADYVIDNSGSLKETRKQVNHILRESIEAIN